MKVFVISLEKRKDRRELFSKTNDSYLSYTFYDGFDGYNLNDKWLLENNFHIDKNWRDPFTKTPVLKGEVGCFLSHWTLWEKCIEINQPIIILEDDAIIKNHIPYHQLKNLVNEYDLIYFDYREQKVATKINDYLEKPNYPYCTHAYLITPKGAEVLLSSYRNNIIPVDEYICLNLYKLNVCCYNKENRFVSRWERDVVGTDIPDGISGYNDNDVFKENDSIMDNELVENGYKVIRNFVTTEQADKVSSGIRRETNSNNFMRDSQAPNADAVHNVSEGLELLVNKNKEVSDLVGASVLPTYCYARVYKNGCDLKKHTDRPECEISLTVNLDGDKEWNFYIENVNGEEKSITLNKGDAILYLGIERPHWRNEYEGDEYTQIFLHYVKQNGQNNDRYFDRKNKISTNDVTDFIYHRSNFLESEFCDKLISEFGDDEWEDAKISGFKEENNISQEVRNCKLIEFSWSDVMNKNYDVRKELDDYIYSKVSSAYRDYVRQYHNVQFCCQEDEGYTLLKYDVGGKYVEHTDHFKDKPRSLTIIINLNDDYTGGELSFRNKTKIYELKKGDLIIFPSNFMYPHEIIPVKSGTRYSLITWMV